MIIADANVFRVLFIMLAMNLGSSPESCFPSQVIYVVGVVEVFSGCG